mgnify:CR=1 FL=1
MTDKKCVEFGLRDATGKLKDVVKLPISEDACFELPKDVWATRQTNGIMKVNQVCLTNKK